jgi:hypothetical protein
VREAVDDSCVKVGRDPATLLRTVHALIDLPGAESGETPVGVRAYRSSRAPVTGTLEELAERLRAFSRAGISHIQLWLDPNTMAGIDAFLPVLDSLDRG